MRFVVGLGNPGPKYVDTRHNFGFFCLEALSALLHRASEWRLVEEASRSGVARWERWQGAEAAEVALLWPLTYMNLSGQAVDFLSVQLGAALPAERILVVVDDMSLPLGQMRLRKKGSSGGHNGLKSIQAHLGHPDYPRLRLGIGQPPETDEVIDFVLSPFSNQERERLEAVTAQSALMAADWVAGVSFDTLVGKVNGWRWEGDLRP